MKLRTFKWFLSAMDHQPDCTKCNGFGGHFDGFDVQECTKCWGTGKKL